MLQNSLGNGMFKDVFKVRGVVVVAGDGVAADDDDADEVAQGVPCRVVVFAVAGDVSLGVSDE